MDARRTSPVEVEVAEIIGTIRAQVAGDRPVPTVNDVIAMMGGHSHTFVILVFCALNMIPGPPGYGGTVALVIMLVAFAMLHDRMVRLPGVIGRRRVPARPLLAMLDRLAWLSRVLARLTAPRFTWLTGPRSAAPMAIFIMVLCLPMMVPIPFMNAIPNVGLTVMSLSRLNRDGIGVVIGIAIASAGVLVDLWIIRTAIGFAMQAGGWPAT